MRGFFFNISAFSIAFLWQYSSNVSLHLSIVKMRPLQESAALTSKHTEGRHSGHSFGHSADNDLDVPRLQLKNTNRQRLPCLPVAPQSSPRELHPRSKTEKEKLFFFKQPLLNVRLSDLPSHFHLLSSLFIISALLFPSPCGVVVSLHPLPTPPTLRSAIPSIIPTQEELESVQIRVPGVPAG